MCFSRCLRLLWPGPVLRPACRHSVWFHVVPGALALFYLACYPQNDSKCFICWSYQLYVMVVTMACKWLLNMRASNAVVSRVFTEGRGGCLRLVRVTDMLQALKLFKQHSYANKTNSRNMQKKTSHLTHAWLIHNTDTWLSIVFLPVKDLAWLLRSVGLFFLDVYVGCVKLNEWPLKMVQRCLEVMAILTFVVLLLQVTH